MDLIEIGKFISELRKEHNLTQEALGEQLGVTNKTVSRWETGTYLPPADILLSMSELYGVSINEILSGKRLTPEEYKTAAETNLAAAIKSSSFSIKDRIEYYKKKWLKDHITVLVLIGILIIAILALGIYLRLPVLVYGAFIALICAHCWRNNTEMAYVEGKVYCDSEK